MKNILLFLLISFGSCTVASAQLFLNLEKPGSAKSERIYPGKWMTFKIEGDDEWRIAELIDLKPETNILIFENQAHPLESIIALRSDKRSKWSRPLAGSLISFGLSWSAFSGIAALANKEYQYETIDGVITGTAVVSGLLLGKLFKYKTLLTAL